MWLQLQNDIYQVAINHGDGGKPVWFTEFGWTDWGEEHRQQTIADAIIEFYDTVKTEMPYVQTAMVFRLTTLTTQDISVGENNFGIMYNKDDKELKEKIRKYIMKGEGSIMAGLYKVNDKVEYICIDQEERERLVKEYWDYQIQQGIERKRR